MIPRSPMLVAALVFTGACGNVAEPVPVPTPRPRCMELPPLSANAVVDSVAVTDTLMDVLGSVGSADFELEVVADSMTTTVRTRRTTLPDSLALVVEQVVDWNALPAMSRRDDRRPALLQSRDTAAPAPAILQVTMTQGLVSRIAVAPGSICRPRMINEPEIMSALARSDAIRLAAGGQVIVRLYIDAEGQVYHSEIVHSSGDPGIDALVRGLVLGAVFEPASLRGRPIPVMTELPFQLNGPRRRR